MRINEKITEGLPHLVGLLFIVILPLFIFDATDERIRIWTYRYYYHLIFLGIAFYVNYLVLVPKFFIVKKRVKFTLTLALFLFAMLCISQYISQKFDIFQPPNRNGAEEKLIVSNSLRLHPRLLDDTVLLLLIFGFSTGMGIIQHSRKREASQKELDKASIETELAFLKNQINPHFFFNSLSNIYALVAIDSHRAQKAIEELSGLMRYLIYESNVELVEINKEFDFTRNYIALMKKRLSSKVKLTINIQKELPNIYIPPLLFISFIENAFKHGISYRTESYIEIGLDVIDNKIIFLCINSLPMISVSPKEEKGGVGISNIKQRLKLLYNDDYTLNIYKTNKSYQVKLIVPTKVTI